MMQIHVPKNESTRTIQVLLIQACNFCIHTQETIKISLCLFFDLTARNSKSVITFRKAVFSPTSLAIKFKFGNMQSISWNKLALWHRSSSNKLLVLGTFIIITIHLTSQKPFTMGPNNFLIKIGQIANWPKTIGLRELAAATNFWS